MTSDSESVTKIEALRMKARTSYGSAGPSAFVAELLEVFTASNKGNGIAWFELGDSLRSLGRFAAARAALLTALEHAPTASRWTVEARLGMVAADSGSAQLAEEWYERATSNTQCAAWVSALRGINLLRLERTALARQCLVSVLDSEDIDRDEIYLNLGLAAILESDYKEAARCAREALQITPDYEEAKKLLKWCESGEAALEFLRDLQSAE